MKRIAIIGGGAGGLAAAIFLRSGDPDCRITVFERMDRVGKKLLATGNGRCNLSNKKVGETDVLRGQDVAAHYFGADRAFALPALRRFGCSELQSWLLSLGMPTVFEGDKLFPYSLNASTVLDVFRLKCEKEQVALVTDKAIAEIQPSRGGFIVDGAFFDAVIVAAGGKAQEKLGSNGSGYPLLTAFGHRLSRTMPAITQIKTETALVRRLKGLKAEGELMICVDQKPVRTERGQILFTDYGVSGPPAFSVSRIASQFGERCEILIDFMPEYDRKSVAELIGGILADPFCDALTLENLLTPVLNKRIGQAVILSAGFALNTPADRLKYADISAIAAAIKAFSLKVTGVQGYSAAQVTAGGILTEGFERETMQSKLMRGLYAVGEVLDVDGDCGGYNLQWAFSSAYAAAQGILSEP